MEVLKMQIVKLRPNADARAIRFGAPWVFGDQLVLDRRTRAIPSGSFVELHDHEGNYTATGTFNELSKITFRVLSRDKDAVLDKDWFSAKIKTALSHREHLYDAPFYRLIHAEGDGLPGLIIDRFGEDAVMQPNAAWANIHCNMLAEILGELGIKNVHLNASGRARKLEGLDDQSRTLTGKEPSTIKVVMNNATYFADLAQGQKTGIFFDQRDNHAFATTLAKGGSILDVFSHIGGFGLAALANGATHATAVDGSQAALDFAAMGAESLGKTEQFVAIKGDAFDVMERFIGEGALFDVVICDPPAFAPGKSALSAGLRAYERVAMLASKLVKPQGYMGLCSCSHAASIEKFASSNLRGIGRAGRSSQVIHKGAAGSDHPTHPYLIESGYLKSIFYRLD